MNYPCACCGYLTFVEESLGTFEICPVCYWEDDNVQNEYPNYEGGANGISLNQARKNFSKYGAVQEKFIKDVKKSLSEKISDE